ncbi:MAG: hypothetical protein J7K37_04595 [Candidatus Omnitrophica bacterium]|nr:hypothetical protein [Candidatus Omnitrophota bacterium]
MRKGSLKLLNNQLLFRDSNNKKILLKGRFKVNKGGDLTYLFDRRSSYKRFGLARRIRFRGRWRLDENHNLVLEVGKQYRSLGLRRLILHTEFIDHTRDGLIFTLKRKISPRRERIEILRLKGKFSTDRFNRIIFKIENKASGVLVFRGAWRVNRDNQIIYNYENLKSKKKIFFVLKGFWQILEKNKLAYVLEAVPKQVLIFRAHLQTLNLYPKKGRLKYRVGIGFGKKRRERIVLFYGEIKFFRRGDLFFEFKSGLRRKVKLGINVNLTKKRKLRVSFYRENGRSLGISLIFKKEVPTFNYFLKLIKNVSDKRVEGGFYFDF